MMRPCGPDPSIPIAAISIPASRALRWARGDIAIVAEEEGADAADSVTLDVTVDVFSVVTEGVGDIFEVCSPEMSASIGSPASPKMAIGVWMGLKRM